MKQLIEFLETNWINISSLLFGLIGIVLAIIFYLKSRKSKLPLFDFDSINLLNEELIGLPNLKIKFKNQTVKNLTATKFCFWNGGKITIDKSDIPNGYELKIVAKKNLTIYDAEIIYLTETANNVERELINDNKVLLINYDYLDFEQGAIINILHSGLSSNDLIIKGKVKGAGNFKQITENFLLSEVVTTFPKNSKVSGYLLFVLIFGFLIGGILIKSIFWKIVLISLGGIYLIFGLRDISKSRLPDNLMKKLNE